MRSRPPENSPALWQPWPRPLWLVVALYTVLALAYNAAQPPFEPSDEQYQFGYIRYLNDHAALPVARVGELSGYHHPPAYFLLAAALSWPFPAPDLADYAARINPYARFRHWEPGVDNKTLYLHGPWDAWPWQATALAVHVTRLISLALGLLTVLLTYQSAAVVFDEDAGLLAACLTAFTPMFTSLSGALQNDLGAAAAGAAVIWLGVRWARHGFTLRRAALLGALAGLAALMKLTAAFLLPPAGLLVLAWAAQAVRRRALSWRRGLGLGASFGLGAAGAAGWWFARNLMLYGDLTANNINLANFGGQTSLWEGLQQWPAMLPYAWTTYWGRIGHGGIVLPDWMYQAVAGLVVLGLFGLAQRWRRAGLDLAQTFLAGAGLFVLLGLLIYITLSPTGANGRYAFPASAAYGALLAAGLLALAPAARRRWAALGLGGLMAVFSTVVLAGYVWPAYALPPALSAVPATATPLDANLGDTARLRGYEVSPPAARPGDRVVLTLYWEPLSPTDRPYSVYVHLLDAADQLIAQRDTYPGLGRNPTTVWTPGRLFADRYLVIVPPETPAPLTAHWKAGLWQAETGDYAFLLDAAGQPVDSGVAFGALTLTSR